ncbi:MAG: glutamate 5-kinase [Thermodesulfobacteriota bacterium]
MSSPVTVDEASRLRRSHLQDVKRVVVKVGSAVLSDRGGLNQKVIGQLADELSFLRSTGREVILVSSGAVAVGRSKLSLWHPHLSLREKQGAAAVGQAGLMRFYEKEFARHDLQVAQVLLTHSDLAHRERYRNIQNTINSLLEWGVVPVINENDTVSVEELRFGDNDTLGALVTNIIGADIFICLTDVDSLYTANPATESTAQPVHTVEAVTDTICNMAGHAGSSLGTGGMRSKIMAARMVAARGGHSFIGPGRQPGVIQRLFGGELLGTFFLPNEEKQKLQSRKHWIAYTLRPKGTLVLDDGACRAIQRHGSSLLAVGIVAVKGSFERGDAVACISGSGKKVGAGLVNYGGAEIRQLMGCNTGDIEKILGYKNSDEIIHRNDLVRFSGDA